jgi:hypothetical protein
MPFTFNGCGTSYYGHRYPAEDGSYVTTLWVTAVWIPLLPLGSHRVRPVGKGTNIIIHSSQSYQTVRVPLCWPQVRNVYLCVSPILAMILYFAGADIQKWWKEDILKQSSSQSALKPEPPRAEPFEADLPLQGKAAAVACGKVLKLDEGAFVRLNLIPRLFQLVHDSGYTDEELKDGSSAKDLQDEAFQAYALAYLTWEKPTQVSRADLDKMVIKAVQSVDMTSLSSAERAQIDAYLVKFKRMMLKAFDLGRHDAKTSPCPF